MCVGVCSVSLQNSVFSSALLCHTPSANLFSLSSMRSSFRSQCLCGSGQSLLPSLHIHLIALFCILCSNSSLDLDSALIGITGYVKCGSTCALYSLSFSFLLSFLNLYNSMSASSAFFLIFSTCLVKKFAHVNSIPKSLAFLVCGITCPSIMIVGATFSPTCII